jgi:hypothetical protein
METENMPSSDIQSINNFPESSEQNELDNQYTKKSQMPKIAGILLLLVGILIIVHWIYITTSPDFIDTLMSTGVYNNMNITRADLVAVFNFCGILASGLSLFTIIGGILAIQMRMFWFAVIGGIVGIFAIAPLFFFVPNILSLLGALLIIRSRKDFH